MSGSSRAISVLALASSGFSDLVSALAEDYCWAEDPNCPACPLATSCAIGQECKAAAEATGRPHKSR